MTVLRINRKRWFRGKGGAESALRLPNGKMCCLGFYGRSKKVPVDVMLDAGLFGHTDVNFCDLDESLFQSMTSIPKYVTAKVSVLPPFNHLENIIAKVNDAIDISDTQREKILQRLFKRYLKIELEFFN